MESILTKENLAEWEGMEEGQLVSKVTKIAEVAAKQMEFSYDSEFKRTLASVMCKLWPNASSPLRKQFCIILRCLCREKKCIDCLLSKELMENVIGSTGLPSCCEADIPEEEKMEAVKCLINGFFHHRPSIFVFIELKSLNGLTMAVSKEKEGEKRYLLLHLIFVVSARSDEAQEYWRGDATLVHLLCEEAFKWEKLERNADEALKVLFNIFCHCNGKGDEAIFEECLQMTRRMLLTVPRGCSHIQNVVNLLGCLPINIEFFYPLLEEGESREFSFDGRSMKVAQVIMDDLGDRLNSDRWEGVELLGTYFTFLIISASASKSVRRYCRMKILPPLHAVDVERPPESGDTMRNKIIRVIQHSSQAKDAACQFLYVLSKRSVPRLIKYTGLGTSAGLLANSGLLGRINEGRRASDSEDSETEDYKEVEERVNPVTGYVRPDEPDPMADMSDEQKIYEAEKLMKAMDRLMGDGFIKPGTIGPDGRPTAVSHVLELVKNVKTPEGSDDESD